jgi:hypothetical protein
MPSKRDIPQRFTTENPVALKSELERLAQALDIYTRQLDGLVKQTPTKDIDSSRSLAYGRAVRVPGRLTGTYLELTLPPPAREDIGKRCAVLRSGLDGTITVVGVGALVGGYSTYTMTNDAHFVEFFLGNDLNFYPSHAGGGAP